jgi:hypothetical protein
MRLCFCQRIVLMSRTRSFALALATLALLLIAASRVEHIRVVEPEADEMNNIYFSQGSPADIIARTPYDWVPGGFLIMGGWTTLVGLHPFVVRWLPLLTFMIGCAFTYRLLVRWRGHDAALLGMLAYGGLGLHIFLSIYTRGYAYPLALLPCALWLTCRYFDHPGWRRALPLALVMVAMFYTQLTSAMAFLMLGIYTLVVYRARVWRWWLPGVMALPLAIPEILRQREVLSGRLAGIIRTELPPLPQALVDLFANYAGSAAVVWAVLLAVAAVTIGMVVGNALKHEGTETTEVHGGENEPQRRNARIVPTPFAPLRLNRILIVLLIWVFLAPVVMYVLNANLGFFSGRYSWWIALGIALLIAWGLARLPRLGRVAASGVLALLLFAPLPTTSYYMPEEPMLANLRWLQTQWRPGDVIVRDLNNTCGSPEEWEMYTRALFPYGLQFDVAPRDHQRVWYVSKDWDEVPDLSAAVRDGRLAGRFVGPPGCLFRLYEGAPDPRGIAFANGMRFHGMQVIDETGLLSLMPIVRREGETLRVRLWWSADTAVDLDYSVGLLLVSRDGQLIAQSDSAPQIILPEGAPPETSRWQQDMYYVEERTLTLPAALSMQTARLELVVYGWWDGVRIADEADDAPGIELADVAISAW